jgi:hypothetical protein
VAPGKSLPRILKLLVEASTVSDDLGKFVQDFFRAGAVRNFVNVLSDTVERERERERTLGERAGD